MLSLTPFPSSPSSRHPAPPQTSFDGLKRAVKRAGAGDLETSTSLSLAASLDKAILPDNDYFNRLLRIMTTRCMMQAIYFCSGTVAKEEFKHYGLASDIYTHFTSPIRRYADVIVHRLLAKAIGAPDASTYGSELTDKSAMTSLTDNLNHRHRMAQQAGRASVELYTHLFFRSKKPVIEEAYIIRVLRNGLIVLIPRYGIEGIIHTGGPKGGNRKGGDSSTPPEGPMEYDEEQDALVERTADKEGKKRSLGLFQRVLVRVQVEDDTRSGGEGGMRSKLSVHLVQPHIRGLSVEKEEEEEGEAQMGESKEGGIRDEAEVEKETQRILREVEEGKL